MVIVGSGVHYWTSIDDDAIYSERGLLATLGDKDYPSPDPLTKYFRSKRAPKHLPSNCDLTDGFAYSSQS